MVLLCRHHQENVLTWWCVPVLWPPLCLRLGRKQGAGIVPRGYLSEGGNKRQLGASTSNVHPKIKGENVSHTECNV